MRSSLTRHSKNVHLGVLPRPFRCACGADISRMRSADHRRSACPLGGKRDGPGLIQEVLRAKLGLVEGVGGATTAQPGTCFAEWSVGCYPGARIDFVVAQTGGFHLIEVDGPYHHSSGMSTVTDPAKMTRVTEYLRKLQPRVAIEWHHVVVEPYKVGRFLEDRLMMERQDLLAAAWRAPPRQGISVCYWWYNATTLTSLHPTLVDQPSYPLTWRGRARVRL